MPEGRSPCVRRQHPIVRPPPGRQHRLQSVDSPRMNVQQGFTLPELIVVLIVAGILAAVAAPNLAEFIKNNSRTTRVNELVTALNFARSEAVKRNADVIVCASTDGNTCAATNIFNNGWVVREVGGNLIRVFQQSIGGVASLIGTDNTGTAVSSVTYRGTGFPANLAAGTHFTHCDDRGVTAARAVVVSNTGHPGISRDSNADGIHDVGGDALSCP